MTRPTSTTVGRGLAAAAAALLLAACSGTGTTTTGASTAADPDDQRLAFISCLRDNGLDIPDDAGQGAPPDLGSVDPDTLQAAFDTCADLVPAGTQGGPLSAVDPADQQRWLDLAACMRSEGIDLEDPTFDAQGRIQLRPGTGGLDVDDPATQQALERCQDQVGPNLAGTP